MKRPPRQVRLDDDVESEIKKIADVTDLSQIEIIRQTIKAGVIAIKENNYQLPLPLRLSVLPAKDIAKNEPGSNAQGGDSGMETKAARIKRPAA